MTKAQKGDLIRITNAYDGEPYMNGDIFEVIELRNNDSVFTADYAIDDCEYEIHRKAGEEDAPNLLDAGHAECQRIADEQDAINLPNHYTQGRFETIEIIEEITQGYSDGYVAYCVGNALKYLARAPFKHGEPTEDIGKAAKYIEFALARLQTQK